MEETWLEELQEHLLDGPRGVAVDIGANVGEWTTWLGEHFATVLAFEPDPRAFEVLNANKPKNAICVNAAVADKTGTATLYMRPSPLQSSITETHPIGGGSQADAPVIEEIEVPTCRIDDLLDICGGQIDAVKMDIEGAEALVLPAAVDIRWRRARWLVEVHDTRKPVGEFFQRMNFQNVLVQPHPYQDAHPEHLWVFAKEALDVTI